MKKGVPVEALTPAQVRMMREAEAIADERIDVSDMPPQTDFSAPRVGAFYRPVKKLVSIRLDADVLEYYRAVSGGAGYQTLINAVLREYAAAHSGVGEKAVTVGS